MSRTTTHDVEAAILARRGPIRLLVSVRNAVEAAAALAGGADWIDLKEPARGALGAVDADEAKQTVDAVSARAPISAAAGELRDWPTGRGRELLAVRGVSYLKLGLSECRAMSWLTAWHEARLEIEAAGKRLVPVLYADSVTACSPHADDVTGVAQASACDWMLIDTYDKSTGSVSDYLSFGRLRDLAVVLRNAGLRMVVAGRLDAATINELPLDLIDMIAVRGAACEGGRTGEVCRERVAELKQQLVKAL